MIIPIDEYDSYLLYILVIAIISFILSIVGCIGLRFLVACCRCCRAQNDNVSTEQPTNGADWAFFPRHIVLSSSYSDRVLGKPDQVDASKGRCRLFDQPNIINAEHEIGETEPIEDIFKREYAKENTITGSKIKMRVSKVDIPNISKKRRCLHYLRSSC